MNGCSGDCQLNTPPRCPCPDRCDSVTKIMQSQRRFLHHHAQYVRPKDQRGKSVNFAECVVISYMPGEGRYLHLNQNDAPSGELVIDSKTGCKALLDFDSVPPEFNRQIIESYFSASAFEVAPRVWVA